MPIVRDEKTGSVYPSYEIPTEIKEKIPEYFYYAMGGELQAIHAGTNIFQKWRIPDEEDEEKAYYYDLDSSTGAWVEAFRATCRKLDMQWLYDYYKTLEWYDSDIFDGEIETEIIHRFCEVETSTCNSYYQYLCECSAKEDNKTNN